jgi:oligoendopeptidase F
MASNSTFVQTRWSLTDLFPVPDSPKIQAAMDELNAAAAEFEGLRDQLATDISPNAFLDIVRRLEAMMKIGSRLAGYANFWFAEDTQNQNAQTFLARIQQFAAEMENRVLFFSLWWKGLEDADANRLMAQAGDYSYWLEAMRHFKPHTLSEPEEKIINIKNVNGIQALQRLYDMITLRYAFKVEVEGETKELTRGELMVYARHHDGKLREQAYRELYRVFGNDGDILGQFYQSIVNDWCSENINLRHFASPIAARSLQNDIPDDVVDMLLEVCEKNASVFQRFFRLKARWLGMERLRRYDIYAPVVKSGKTYPFNQAAEMVLTSFTYFEPKVADLARRVFLENHLDSEIRKGKDSGAFCGSVTNDLTPWVLMNYQGRPDDVATLAHELGHAVHSILAHHHSLFTFHASLPLAETASTFGEMLLVDHLLAEEEDEAVRRDLLFRQVDGAYSTIMRQAFFAMFERQAHDMTQHGALVSDLADTYLENLHKQFGKIVDVPDEFRWEWVSIPHFYQVPFYVYAYSFGQLLVLSLYQQYKAEGDSFKPRYLKILEAGGSDAPMRVLSKAGIDASRAEFWQGGFDVIKALVEQLENIPVVK